MKLLAAFTLSLVSYAQGLFPMPGPGNPPAGGGTVTYTYIQDAVGSIVSSGTTMTVALGSNPTAGNAVGCAVWAYPSSISISTVKDGNNNSYTVTPNSPSAAQASSVPVYMAYLLTAPGNAEKNITVTMSGTITFSSSVRCMEFHRSSGTWAFDTDVAGSAASGTTVNTPSITPAAAGGLLYSAAYHQSSITSVNSPWTVDSGSYVSTNIGSGYILSASSGATALNMTAGTTGTWNSMAMAFK